MKHDVAGWFSVRNMQIKQWLTESPKIHKSEDNSPNLCEIVRTKLFILNKVYKQAFRPTCKQTPLQGIRLY
jgi:hypothetical protein